MIVGFFSGTIVVVALVEVDVLFADVVDVVVLVVVELVVVFNVVGTDDSTVDIIVPAKIVRVAERLDIRFDADDALVLLGSIKNRNRNTIITESIVLVLIQSPL